MTGRPVVLFVTDNGHGLGHLTRMMAVARHAQGRFRPVFLTLSEAYPLLRESGMPVEYMPSFTRLGITSGQWWPVFGSNLASLINHVRPSVVIIDHIRPPSILAQIREASHGVDFIWSRRGMWRPGRNIDAVDLARHFDLVVEPGDIASPIDVGATTESRDRVAPVAPVVLVEPDDRIGREPARESLGLSAEGTAVLVQLSDSDQNNLADQTRQVRDTVRSVTRQNVVFFAPLHPLHRGPAPEIEGVTMRPVFPMAKHLDAFDGVVSSAGYNSFHEVVASGVPAVFVPRDTESLDHQARRAEFAELCGRAFYAPSIASERFRRGVQRMLAPEEATIARRVTGKLGSFEGAVQFADLIAERCEARAGEQAGVAPFPEPILTGKTMTTLHSTTPSSDTEVVIVVALGIGNGLADATDRITAQATTPLRPVFLIDDADPRPLRDRSILYETVTTPAEWSQVSATGYTEYLDSRIADLEARFRAERVMHLASEGHT